MKPIGSTDKSVDTHDTLITGYHKSELIDANNVHFENCVLENCIIVYSGGDVSWTNLQHKKCTFRFIGSAQKTINFLRGFQTGKKDSGSISINDLIPVNEQIN